MKSFVKFLIFVVCSGRTIAQSNPDDVTNSVLNHTGTPPSDKANGGPNSLAIFIQTAMSLTIYRVGDILDFYVVPIIYAIGLFGNFLSALVMFSKESGKVSSYIYMGVLAMVDSMALISHIIKLIIKQTIMAELPMMYQRLVCRVTISMAGWSSLSSTILILAMKVDRFIATRWPLKAIRWCSTKRARYTCVIAIFAAFCIKLPYSWLTDVFGVECSTFGSLQAVDIQLYYWINATMSCYLPFTLLITLNSIIIHSLRRRNTYFHKQEGSSGQKTQQTTVDSSGNTAMSSSMTSIKGTADKGETEAAKRSASNKSVTVMLLLVSFAFLLLNAPMYMAYLVYLIKSYWTSPFAFAEAYFTANMVGTLWKLNHGINFYLYCLSGSKFRNELKDILSKILKI